jgi:ABC-type glycerol-3-phosphate transport system substrate-binding protein
MIKRLLILLAVATIALAACTNGSYDSAAHPVGHTIYVG